MTTPAKPPTGGPLLPPSKIRPRTPAEGIRGRALDDAYAGSPRLMALCDYLFKHDVRVLLGALAVAVLTAGLASRLELRTNLAELLPSRDPAVEELKRSGARIGGTQVLQVAVESADREANLAFAGEVTARLKKLPPELVRMAAYDVRDERAFFAAHKWLYADLGLLEEARDALKARIDRAKNPLLVDLLDAGDSLEDVGKKLKERAGKLDRFSSGFFEGDGGKIVAIVIRPPGGLFAERAGEPLRDATLKIIAELDPKTFACRFHKGSTCEPIRVGLTGDVMAQLDERAALENDLVWATGICVLLVGLAVVLFYGRLRAVPFVALPALIGVAVAFGSAELFFGYLNSSTAFMGSIVVGNGINFAIIQYARYEEERRRGVAPGDAAKIALHATLRPTAVAALGAAAAYASLCVTRFRGFSQFGIIGGVGMVAAWGATVIVLPALWARFDREGSSQRRRFPWPERLNFADLVSRTATRIPRTLLVVSSLATVVALVPLARYLGDPFEYDFTKLRNSKSLTTGAAAIAPRVDHIFGRTLTPAAIVADRRDQTEQIRKKILERDKALGGKPVIGEVRTLEDFLPGSLPVQQKKLAVLSELRELIDDPALKLLEPDERARLSELRPPEGLRPVDAAELPETVRQPFTELDGTLGRIVLVYHDEDVSVWDGHNLIRIAQVVGEIPLDDGTLVRSSGHAVVFASMIRSIDHDAPLATMTSLFGVALLVMVLARGRRGALLVIATLLAGVAWMVGAAAWLGVRTNFLNFIALPITFGIGVDYGINIYLRYRLEGRGRVGRAVRATGGAVALCSLTTIIGYGALLVADNLALRSFGAMAILGEVACLSAAVLVMPAFLVWMERRDGQAERDHAPASAASAE